MASFDKNDSLAKFQQLVNDIYGENDDRLYSIWDIMSNVERFSMRGLKGIRKGDREKLTVNLLLALSWTMALANRLHVEIEDRVWRRFPMLCSYCAKLPCDCKKIKPKKRVRLTPKYSLRPHTLSSLQEMFEKIYPASSRTLDNAGVHLAEEVGEVSEAIHGYMGEHKQRQLEEIKNEIADLLSCVFGVANSARINVALELASLYSNNCHVCHQEHCTCTFASALGFKS